MQREDKSRKKKKKIVIKKIKACTALHTYVRECVCICVYAHKTLMHTPVDGVTIVGMTYQ